jgi:hypothetical protein
VTHTVWLHLPLALWTWAQAAHLERIEAVRAVEQTRALLAAGTATPLDPAAIRDLAARQVGRALQQEALLRQRFGVRVSPELLAAELERIEAHTQDAEGWAAVKAALGNDRRAIEETVCRPLVVDRLLRHGFAFDDSIHSDAHARARQARSRFLAGQPVEASHVLLLARRPEVSSVDVRAWLAETRAQTRGPRVLWSPEQRPEPRPERPMPLHPDAARVLEAQLQRSGDVSTILSEPDRFAVYRLIEATEESWKVEAAVFLKRDFAQWFRETTAGHDE